MVIKTILQDAILWRPKVEVFIDSVLYCYSGIFFIRHRLAGLLFLVATLVRPWGTSTPGLLDGHLAAISGLGAILLVSGLIKTLKLHSDSLHEGYLGYNALLVGLAIPSLFEPSPAMYSMIVVSVVGVTLLTTGMRSVLGFHFNLPVLSMPFLLVVYSVMLSLPVIRTLERHVTLFAVSNPVVFLPTIVTSYLEALGAVFFAPNALSGGLIFLGLILVSRYAVFLTMLGYCVAWYMSSHVLNLPQQDLSLYIAFNFMLTALALGGVWFVPQRSSLILALVGMVVCAALLAGASGLFFGIGLPMLILPFNLTMLLMLSALGQRTEDKEPKFVDFMLGSPEANRANYQSRLVRFGTRSALRIELPFRGTWLCTQGVDGPLTHQGLWRHGFDFEISDESGAFYSRGGLSPEDFYCWKLPVLACGEGIVVQVVDNVPDNAIGEINTMQNWGNLVMIEHAVGVYSVVCHLARGSVKVSEGGRVRSGDVLGACGNSGRSPKPHLHIQFQAIQSIGAATIQGEFNDVILDGEKLQLQPVCIPDEGQKVRRVDRQTEMAELFSFPLGRKLICRVTMNGEVWYEEIEPEMDIFGNLKLVSTCCESIVFYENRQSSFLILDYQGPQDSALFPLACSLFRVPLENTKRLNFTDILPFRHFMSGLRRILAEIFTRSSNPGIEICYHFQRNGNELRIIGNGSTPSGESIATTAILNEGKGLSQVQISTPSLKMTVIVEDQNG